jgi:hypothetical protein
MKQKLAIASIGLALVGVVFFFFNATKTAKSANFVVQSTTIELCKMKFTEFEASTSVSGVKLISAPIELEGSPLSAMAPVQITKKDPNQPLVVSLQGSIENPLIPDVPIVPESEMPKVCKSVGKYVEAYQKNKTNLSKAFKSEVFALSSVGPEPKLVLKPGYSESITANAIQTQVQLQSFKQSIQNRYEQKVANKRKVVHDFIIFYEGKYQNDVNRLAAFYNSLGIRTEAVELSQLPGYRATDPVPEQCQGEFYKECYHSWDDPIQSISKLAVPSLPGYVPSGNAFEPYSKVAFIPGLIRAYLRYKKSQHPLAGALLVGSAERIPPYYTRIKALSDDGFAYDKNQPSMKLSTDLYYTLPNVPLVLSSKSLAHQIISPNIWTCNGPNEIRRDYWCENNEARHWPNPPLSAYRFPPYTPDGKIYSLKYKFGNPYWNTINYQDVIPIGRLVTPGNWNRNVKVVGNYVDKVIRWYQELPQMKGNSIYSIGGTTEDSWIYRKEDLHQFQSVFGNKSKIYASEFFVPSDKCNGRCEYQNATSVMAQIGLRNRVAFLLNGHGGHIGIQAPYANGDVASTYINEKSVKLDDWLRLKQHLLPADSTIKQVEDQARLVGIVFANSCSTSNYLKKNQLNNLIANVIPNAGDRSFAEEWIAMKNSGAINTFLNVDVGFGDSDSTYNIAFMEKIQNSWESCGGLGDALRMLILDNLRGPGYLGWQLFNRQLLGSPINPIAVRTSGCAIAADQMYFGEEKAI